jgi:hypothetical protein
LLDKIQQELLQIEISLKAKKQKIREISDKKRPPFKALN